MLAELKAEHEKNPDSIEAIRAIAEYYLSNNMEEKAEPYLTKVLELDENIVDIHNQLGIVYFKLSQYGKAEHHFKEALRMDFRMPESHFNLAFLYQVERRFAEALPYYKEAANLDPEDSQTYRLMGQCAQAVRMWQEAETFFVESFRLDPSIDTAMDLGMLYITEEKYAEAEEILDFLLDTMAEDKVGTVEEDADARPSPHIECRLDSEALHFVIGLVLGKQGKYLKAIEHLRDVMMRNDQNGQAANYLGECYAAIGSEKEAESFFSRAREIDPEYPQPILNMGKLYLLQGRHHEAITVIEEYIEIIEKLKNDEVEMAYKLLGESYLQIGDVAKAIGVWEESLEANPDQPEIISLVNDCRAPVHRKISLSMRN